MTLLLLVCGTVEIYISISSKWKLFVLPWCIGRRRWPPRLLSSLLRTIRGWLLTSRKGWRGVVWADGILSSTLSRVAREIPLLADSLGIVLWASHLPGRFNMLADASFRRNQVIAYKWSWNRRVLHQVFHLCGSPDVKFQQCASEILFSVTQLNMFVGKRLSPFHSSSSYSM